MALICILIGLIFDRASDILENRRSFTWFDNYSRWLLQTLPGLTNQHRSSILILLLPVLLVTGLLQSWFEGHLHGLVELLFGLIVFAFCLGPEDLNRQINQYLDARESGDEELAHSTASSIMQAEAPSDPDQQVVEVMRATLHEANERLFAVIFWFVVLGPLGAIMFRLTSHTMRNSSSATVAGAARHLLAILAWAPAHLAAMGYALTGNYEGSRQEFSSKNQQDELAESNYFTLISAGQGALRDCSLDDETSCIRSARALVLRTMVVWLACIAIFTLFGWMS